MRTPRGLQWVVLALVGGTALTLCDSVHIAYGVLEKTNASIAGQSWWTLPMFSTLSLFIVPLYRRFRCLTGARALATGKGELAFSSVAFLASYACTGPLGHWDHWLAVLLTAAWLVRLLRRRVRGIIFFSLLLAVAGPAVEAAISASGAFHYTAPDLFTVPSWLPMIYLHGALLVADLDGFLGGYAPSMSAWKLSPRSFRWMLNVFPPLMLQRIRIVSVGADFQSCRVRIAKSPLTRNLHGATFGGTIFAAADPIAATLFWQLFARRGVVVETWLQGGSVYYSKPARSALTIDVRLSDEDVASAVEELDERGRFRRTFELEARDRGDEVCARITTEIYVRKGREARDGHSAF
ncbi:MAG: YiiD C-terminal domain-containing protein [Planctomycetota bacterium]|jgi:acyl-coenzyme A thioesterase PaaI-like protein|nr:YiiD C-terminal domain-containing protein [Planctomycetota bacterium]MDP6761460.1 YiiD C-terminal domain-containing protein [Planctomycetota bacterium]MDP6988090.1 YiiD C-terminal domain-containing protein [Planctomycetota bacterium]